MRAYCAGLIDAIAKAADDPRPAVRRQAKFVWSGAAERLVYDLDGNAERGIAAFEQIVDHILQEDPEFSGRADDREPSYCAAPTSAARSLVAVRTARRALWHP